MVYKTKGTFWVCPYCGKEWLSENLAITCYDVDMKELAAAHESTTTEGASEQKPGYRIRRNGHRHHHS